VCLLWSGKVEGFGLLSKKVTPGNFLVALKWVAKKLLEVTFKITFKESK